MIWLSLIISTILMMALGVFFAFLSDDAESGSRMKFVFNILALLFIVAPPLWIAAITTVNLLK